MKSTQFEHDSVERTASETDHIQPQNGLSITLKQVGKNYGNRQVLQQVSVKIKPGEFVAVVGKSGCGKSTFLRLLSQLEEPSSGTIHFNTVSRQAEEHTRIMFQDARLLPWKTVRNNVALGVKRHVNTTVEKRLLDVGLGERKDEWPFKLSGGQQQRVALARALAHSPKLLLLDEPLGALDALTRQEMQSLIEQIWQKEQFTAVIVTHDVSEAVALADRVIVIDNGTITLDFPIQLPRPRSKGDSEFAKHEKILLSHLLGN